jgi:hypothetical protein
MRVPAVAAGGHHVPRHRRVDVEVTAVHEYACGEAGDRFVTGQLQSATGDR